VYERKTKYLSNK
jgi:hypothetical protein